MLNPVDCRCRRQGRHDTHGHLALQPSQLRPKTRNRAPDVTLTSRGGEPTGRVSAIATTIVSVIVKISSLDRGGLALAGAVPLFG